MFELFTTATATDEKAIDLNAASKQVEQAKADLESWRQRASDLRREIAHLKEYAGATVLQSGDVAGTAGKIRATRDELSVCESAIEAATAAVNAAEREYQRADAHAKRKEAVRLRKQADDLDGKCQKHFDALKELQGVDYAPACDARINTDGMIGGAPKIVYIPQSRAWRNEAKALDKQAGEIERKLQQGLA